MLTVEDYGRIRIAHRDGMSIRQIARRDGHSRRKIRQVLGESEPRPYTLRQGRPAPRLGPYKALCTCQGRTGPSCRGQISQKRWGRWHVGPRGLVPGGCNQLAASPENVGTRHLCCCPLQV